MAQSLFHQILCCFFLLFAVLVGPFSYSQPLGDTSTQPNAAQAETSVNEPEERDELESEADTTQAESGSISDQEEEVADRDVAGVKNTISSIKIKGNKKIEAAAIRAKLTSQVKGSYSAAKVKQDIAVLFKTGLFYDVVVEKRDLRSGIQLIYSVVERPSILSIQFVDNEEIDDEELTTTIPVKVYQTLDVEKVKDSALAIKKLYEEKGFFLAEVNFEIKDGKDGIGSHVRFFIEENEKVRVKEIRLLGNKELSSDHLKSRLMTQEGGFFSYVFGDGAFQKDAFDRDVQILTFLYYNEGYVKVKIGRPQVFLSPDRKGIFITIYIEEGPQFDVGEIAFTGDLLFDEDELNKDLLLKEGDLFVHEKLQYDLRKLQAKYGDLGYAYANVIPQNQIIERDRKVNITYEIDKGEKVYIGKINVVGNTRTRDKVVRREMEILEGELYNESRKRESEDNIQRLGFFETVSFDTRTPPGRPEIMDIDVVVKERNTGQAQIGAGYSDHSKFVFNGNVKETNFLGLGQNLGFSLNIDKNVTNYSLNWTDPYFNDSKWSLGTDLTKTKTDRSSYSEDRVGGALRLGHPLARYLYGYVRYKYENVELKRDDEADAALFPVDTVNGVTSSVTGTIRYDKLNDRFAPSKGILASSSVEYAGLGGDLEYTKGAAVFQYYKKLFWDIVWRNNINYGFVSPNSGDEKVPFNQLYLLGGANSLRGFKYSSIGKRKFSALRRDQLLGVGYSFAEAEQKAYVPFGGRQQLVYNLEFEFDLIEEAKIKGVVFYDLGYADDELRFEDFRSNYGFGFRWFSPIGPLRFEWGFPINPDKTFDEDPMFFQFSVGKPF